MLLLCFVEAKPDINIKCYILVFLQLHKYNSLADVTHSKILQKFSFVILLQEFHFLFHTVVIILHFSIVYLFCLQFIFLSVPFMVHRWRLWLYYTGIMTNLNWIKLNLNVIYTVTHVFIHLWKDFFLHSGLIFSNIEFYTHQFQRGQGGILGWYTTSVSLLKFKIVLNNGCSEKNPVFSTL